MYAYIVDRVQKKEWFFHGTNHHIAMGNIGDLCKEIFKSRDITPIELDISEDEWRNLESYRALIVCFNKVVGELKTRIAFYDYEFISSDDEWISELDDLNVAAKKFIVQDLYILFTKKMHRINSLLHILHGFEQYDLFWRQCMQIICSELGCFCHITYPENIHSIPYKYLCDETNSSVKVKLYHPHNIDSLYLLKEFLTRPHTLYNAFCEYTFSQIPEAIYPTAEKFLEQYEKDIEKSIQQFGDESYTTANELIHNNYHEICINPAYWECIYAASSFLIHKFGNDIGQKLKMCLMLYYPFKDDWKHPFWENYAMLHTTNTFLQEYFEYDHAPTLLREAVEFNFSSFIKAGKNVAYYICNSISDVIETVLFSGHQMGFKLRQCQFKDCNNYFLNMKNKQIYCCDECKDAAKRLKDNTPSIRRTCNTKKHNRTKLKTELINKINDCTTNNQDRINWILNYIYLCNYVEAGKDGTDLISALENSDMTLSEKEAIATVIFKSSRQDFSRIKSVSLPFWYREGNTISYDYLSEENGTLSWEYLYTHSEANERTLIHGFIQSLLESATQEEENSFPKNFKTLLDCLPESAIDREKIDRQRKEKQTRRR